MEQPVSNKFLKTINQVSRGSAVFLISLILSLTIVASLVNFNVVIIQHENEMIFAVLIISSYLGAKTAVLKTNYKRYIICAISTIVFVILLFLCSVLVNVSEKNYLGAKIMVIACGSMLPIFHRKTKTKKLKPYKRK